MDRTALSEAVLVAVGDELLLGRTVDSNSAEIARALSGRGLPVRGVTVVPDDAAAIGRALDAAPAGALVCLTGGLGPTPDDLTREAVAAWAGVALDEEPELAERLRRRSAARGLPWGEGIARQARVPAGLAGIPNPAGSAPGLLGVLRGRTLLLLPGVPHEMRALLPEALDRLQAAGALPALRPAVLLRTAQVGESRVAELCRPARAADPRLLWSWWLVRWGVDVRISLPAGLDDSAALEAAGAALRRALGVALYAEGTRELPDVVRELLVRAGATVAVAESCTGGGLGAALTSVPGSSACFAGGVIAYADAVKTAQLGVEPALLVAHGAVSRECALAMAAGARARFGTDYGAAITGVAGPDGGTPEKPVGTVWIAIDARGTAHARRYRFPGDRRRNRQLAVAATLDALRRLLQRGDDVPPWDPLDTWGAARGAEARP